MNQIIGRPVKYIRLDNSVIYLIPSCYGSYLDSENKRDCRFCPVSRECEMKRASIVKSGKA